MASHRSRLFCLRTLSLSIFFYYTYCHFQLVLGNDVDSLECLPAPNVSCRLSNGTEFRFSGEEVGFNQSIPCRNIVGPSDKSDYIVDYYGARLTRLSITNDTYRRTQISP
ncbi:unnamed protein product [Coregonus sp. 'balchen']|nr:unnamed protein product [Coregonus sp. 'balchen']